MDKVKQIQEIFGSKVAKIVTYIMIITLCIYYHEWLIHICKVIIARLIENPFAILFIMLLVTIRILLIKSDKESNKIIKDYYKKHTEYEFIYKSEDYRGIKFILIENVNVNKKELIIKIVNSGIKSLQYIKGIINFYKSGNEFLFCKINEFPFEYKELRVNTEAIIKTIPLIEENKRWIRFDLQIDAIEFQENERESDIEIEGKLFIRNPFWILDYFDMYDNKLLCFKTKYNLWWLKGKVKKITSIIKFYCSNRVCFMGNNLNQEYKIIYIKDRIRKWVCRILFSILMLFLISIIGLGALQFIKFIKFIVLLLSQLCDYLIKWFGLNLPPK